jgi:hypothetical protein
LESRVRSDTCTDAIAPVFGVPRQLTRSVQLCLEQWLNLCGAAFGGYPVNVSNQVVGEERHVRALTWRPGGAVEHHVGWGTAGRAKAVDASERERVTTDAGALLDARIFVRATVWPT